MNEPDQVNWPDDGITTLVFNAETSKFETNDRDKDAALNYQGNISNLDLCSESTGDQFGFYSTNSGGIALYNKTTEIATFVDGNGKITGYGGAAEVTASQPR